MEKTNPGAWLSLKATISFTGLSKSTLYRLRTDPESGFPQPRGVLSKVLFSQEELEEWLRAQPRRSLLRAEAA